MSEVEELEAALKKEVQLRLQEIYRRMKCERELEKNTMRILRTLVIVPGVNGDAIHEKEVLQQFRGGQWVDIPVVTEKIQMPFWKAKERFDNE